MSGRKDWKEKGYHFYDELRPYFCKHCGQRYADWDLYLKHYKYVKKKIEEKIMKEISPALSDKGKEKALQNRLNDDKDYRLLQESYEENKRRRPFVCNMCGKTFKSKKYGLKPHLKKVHGIDVDAQQVPKENKTDKGGN